MSNPNGGNPRELAISRSLTRIERDEVRAVRRVAAAYRQAKQEIIADVLNRWAPNAEGLSRGAVVNTARQLGILRAIDDRMIELERQVGVELRDIVQTNTQSAIEQIQSEINLLPANIRPTVEIFSQVNTNMIEQFVPIGISDAQLSTRAISLQLQREIQAGLLQGESFPDLIRRLMSTEATTGASIWARGETSATLSIRRLVITSENAAKNEALRVINSQGGTQVQRQAIAAISPETTDCCLRVHGQIREVDEPFTLTGTPRFADQMLHPSFHYNCRTSIAMYHPIFEQSYPTATMRDMARAELQRRQ